MCLFKWYFSLSIPAGTHGGRLTIMILESKPG
jgi:hypothetical protein